MIDPSTSDSTPSRRPNDIINQSDVRDTLASLSQTAEEQQAMGTSVSRQEESNADPFQDATLPRTLDGDQTFEDLSLLIKSLPGVVGPDNWAIKKAEERVSALTHVIEELALKRGLPYANDMRVLLIGSMGTGHFTGPKPREHSQNLDCPYDAVVEGDLRVIVPAYVDPHDPEAIALVQDSLLRFGTIQQINTAEIHRGDTDMHQTYFYQYDNISDDSSVGYEWEVCLNNEPYYEIAEIWKDVFTQDEIRDQVIIRELLRCFEAPLSSEFKPTKDIHCNECLWRVVSSYALDTLQREHAVALPEVVLESLPLTGKVPEAISWLVDSWLQGESGFNSLDRPTLTVVPAARGRFEDLAGELEHSNPEMAEYIMSLLNPAQGPLWVRYANRVQSILKEKREGQIDRGDEDPCNEDPAPGEAK